MGIAIASAHQRQVTFGFKIIGEELCHTVVLFVDRDGDGVDDCRDGCPGDPNKTSPGRCGCGKRGSRVVGDCAPVVSGGALPRRTFNFFGE